MKETDRGISLEPMEASKEAIRRNVEIAMDWPYREIATTLYRWTDIFRERLLDPVAIPGRGRMPDIVLSFERMNIRTMATYTLNRNAQGLLNEITFNTKHVDAPLWETLETLLHEMVHLWQQNFGEHPLKPGRVYHNREFVDKCNQLGLHPQLGSGAHSKPADRLFALLMREHGIDEPSYDQIRPEGRGNWWDRRGKERKGRSTLAKWTCGCQNVRVGTKEFHACCLKCGNVFARVDNETKNEQAHPASAAGHQATSSGGTQAEGGSAHLLYDGSPRPGENAARL
jgi:hypothetical protein